MGYWLDAHDRNDAILVSLLRWGPGTAFEIGRRIGAPTYLGGAWEYPRDYLMNSHLIESDHARRTNPRYRLTQTGATRARRVLVREAEKRIRDIQAIIGCQTEESSESTLESA